MSKTRLAWAATGVGLFVLLSRWGSVVERASRGEGDGQKQVVYWTSSGSPEYDLMMARSFEEENPDTDVVPRFRETGGLQDAVFVSFLSGNPPDVLAVSESDLREMVAMGMLRPLDDLLERQLEAEPDFLTQRVDGRPGVHVFQADPNDRFIREMDRYPKQAARLLNMHGRFVGFRDTTSFQTLTYNKRVFREAAAAFPDAGLVDERNEPVPPATWSELVRVAKVITDYGRKQAREEGRSDPDVYGLVVQGRRPHDIMRGIEPLAAVAGSRGFNFAGRRPADGSGDLRGFYEYESPAMLAAFRLLLQLKTDGCVLPGTESRPYEDVRVELARGHAAMLIDGWHAALIGNERVPWARNDIGSAPIPVPDEGAEALLGIRVGKGRMYRFSGGGTRCITSLSETPWETWKWITFASSPGMQKVNVRRGALPGTFGAARMLKENPDWFRDEGDPTWSPNAYQTQAWDILTTRCALWPEPPTHGPVQELSEREVFHSAFLGKTRGGSVEETVEMVRERLARFSAACNEDLERRVRDGEARPEHWTFADWDPADPRRFFERQNALASDGGLGEEIERLRAELARRHPVHAGLGHGYESSESGWQLLFIPGAMVAVALAFLGWSALRDRGAGRPVLAGTRSAARGRWEAYVFVLPAMLALFAFVVYPSIYQLYLSLHSGTGVGPLRWSGLGNYGRVLSDGLLPLVLWNTLLYMVITTAGRIALALVFASLLSMPIRGSRFYRTCFFIPMATSLAAVSVVMLGLLMGPDSGLNRMLVSLGVATEGDTVDWLGDSGTALYTIMAVGIWHGLPYTIILVLAGLQSISPQLYEAAKVDGAGPVQRFVHITIPELMPILAVIVFNSLVNARRAFGVVYVLTEGGSDHSSELVSTYIFKWGFTRPMGQEPDVGYASAMGIVYALLLAALVFVNVRIIAGRWRRRLEATPGRGARDDAWDR